ncbi:CYFA0S05e03686g1_1 [Cyberlindnera fabianii]|uniref:E3 ubiquitin-protein ligase n=1 Tax=Cyberlindnera fabianii TaxID=36022 RepID=A0A061AZ91_CYBFA|nr:CYFA0S05e03686g1_1 [Cyberlindnera fabianii]
MNHRGGDCALPCTFVDNGELLKKALLQFPKRYQHDFSRPAKVDLRRLLSFAASYKGTYMKELFPEVDELTLPKAWQHVLVPERYQHLESQDFYFQRGSFDDPAHPHRACGRKFKKGEPVYRCMTCSDDETSGLCQNCFDADQHDSHDVITSICQRENGGVCDCGDEEAWRVQLNCKHYHTAETPESEIPEKFKNSLLQTFEIVLDYIVDVMSSSPLSFSKDRKQNNESILMDGHSSTLEQGMYFGTDWPSDKFHLMLYNDQNRQYRDAVQRITSTTDKVDDFAIMVADEVNVNGRAKVMTSSHIDELLQAQSTLEATGLASLIRNARDVFREEMCGEMVLWLTEMMNGPVHGNYNITRDILAEAFCQKWKIGVKPTHDAQPFPGSLFNNEIPTIPSRTTASWQFGETSVPQTPEHWKVSPVKWDIDPVLAARCDYDPDFIRNTQSTASFHGSRFQYILYFDIRLWKSIRSNMHTLLNSVLTSNKRFRPLVCAQYTDIYPTILELFFLFDREPEFSCMTTLTSQIFTSSLNATMIANHGDLTRFLAAIYSYLTKLFLMRPEDIVISKDLLSTSFKNRRIGQVFFEICCVLNKTKSFSPILCPEFMNQVCDILDLFQGKPTLKREAVEHVEYESNDYGLYFNMYSVISSLAEMIAKTLLKTDSAEGLNWVALIFDRIGLAGEMPSDQVSQGEPTDVGPLNKIVIESLEGPQEIVSFKLENSPVSFLHPLHAFATWVVQYSNIGDTYELERFLRDSGDLKFHILEYPLRTLVLLAQIRVGYWVRNGFSIRTQQHIYRTSGIRESGFKRDFYMIQLMMCLLDRDLVVSSFLSRWALLSWCKEELSPEPYDETILPLMVEEFLLSTIQLLSDTSALEDFENSTENRIKKEIIHCLCFQPMSYSKICSDIPDYMAHEKRFDLILSSVANYIPPASPSAAGMYKLKEEFMDQVDPFYVHYSTNKRDEAEKLVKERIAKKTGLAVKDVYIEPSPHSLANTPFKNLFKITSSKIFVQFIRSTLKVVNNEGVVKTESLLNLSLHLIHLASAGSELAYSAVFNELIFSEFRADHNEPFYYESVGALLYKFLTDETCAAYHSKIRAIFKVLKSYHFDIEAYLHEQVQNFDASLLGIAALTASTKESEFEKKKRMAKERREKIMAKFKRKQTEFVEKNNVEPEAADISPEDAENGNSWHYPEEHCILCQMSVTTGDSVFGVVCNVSRFSGSRTVPFHDKYWTLRSFEESGSLDDDDCVSQSECLPGYFEKIQKEAVVGPAFPSHTRNALRSDMMATSCGHGMHYSCYQNYLSSAKARQTQITRTVPEDFENFEFICPLCKSLGNLFIPIMWNNNKNKLSAFTAPDQDWYSQFEKIKNISFVEPEICDQFSRQVVEDCKLSLKNSFKDMAFDDEQHMMLHDIWVSLSSKLESITQPQFREHLNKLVSSTIKGTEISVRGLASDTGLVTGLISNQCLTTLRILTELKKTWVALAANPEANKAKPKGFSVKFAEEMVGKLVYLSSDRLFDVFEDIDFFELLVGCTPFYGISMNSLYRLTFTYHFIQQLAIILAQLHNELFEGEISILDITVVKAPETAYYNLVAMARDLRDNHPLFDNVSDGIFESIEFQEVLYTLLVRSLTPFLRRVAIWSIANCADYSDVSLDPWLEDEDVDGLEVNRLCDYLNIPSVEEMLALFSGDGVENQKFQAFLKYVSTTDNELSFKSLEYTGQVRLVDLPERMDDIFTQLLYKKYKFTSLAHYDPAICLFCGDIVNLQKKAPGQVIGECNHHAENECLNDMGLFLLPKHSATLLLDRGNGSFHPAPYIDSHGEYDSDVRQNQVLLLSRQKYDTFIRQMWLQHDVKNFITRKLEGTVDIGGWETL